MEKDLIIKALECCFVKTNCNGCPLDRKTDDCLHLIGVSAMACIKELTEENERLRAEKEAVNKESFYKWKKLADETADRYEGLYQDAKKSLVADTVRKMHSEIKERCIKGGIYPAFVARVVEEVVKEIANE